MVRLRLIALVGALGMLAAGSGAFSQDKEVSKEKPSKEDDAAVKARGQLPANWSKLGLTDEQKQKTYKIRAKYKDQTEELAAKIRAIKAEETKELQTVLTPEQKKHLIEIKTGEKAVDDKAKEEKKVEEKKEEKK